MNYKAALSSLALIAVFFGGFSARGATLVNSSGKELSVVFANNNSPSRYSELNYPPNAVRQVPDQFRVHHSGGFWRYDLGVSFTTSARPGEVRDKGSTL